MNGKTKYLSKRARRELIFKNIIELAEGEGLFSFTINDIARLSTCACATVKSHFGNMKNIREEAIIHAKAENISSILNTPITDMLNP